MEPTPFPTPVDITTGHSTSGQITSPNLQVQSGCDQVTKLRLTPGPLAANGIVNAERNGAEGMSSQPCPFRHLDRTDAQWRLSAASSTSHFTNYFITCSSKTQTIFPTWEFFPERLIPCQHQPIVASCYCLFKVLLFSVLPWAKFYKNTTFRLLFSSFLSLCWAAKSLHSTLLPLIPPHPTWGSSF